MAESRRVPAEKPLGQPHQIPLRCHLAAGSVHQKLTAVHPRSMFWVVRIQPVQVRSWRLNEDRPLNSMSRHWVAQEDTLSSQSPGYSFQTKQRSKSSRLDLGR